MNNEIKNEINNVENNENINIIDISSNIIKTINTIIKDLSISPQKKLYIYINSKPYEMINEKNNYKYYLYDVKEMKLAPYGAEINLKNSP